MGGWQLARSTPWGPCGGSARDAARLGEPHQTTSALLELGKSRRLRAILRAYRNDRTSFPVWQPAVFFRVDEGLREVRHGNAWTCTPGLNGRSVPPSFLATHHSPLPCLTTHHCPSWPPTQIFL